MRRTKLLGARLLAALPAVALAAASTGCGIVPGLRSDEEPKPKSSALFSLLPASIRESKTIRVGLAADYPPMAYFDTDGKTPIGFDPDLAAAIAKALDLEVAWVPVERAALVDGLRAGRYDIVISALRDTKARQKEVDLVDYFTTGSSILVRKGNPEFVYTLDDLCGRTVGVWKGSVQERQAAAQRAACTKARKRPMRVVVAGTLEDGLAEVRRGRAVALLADYPVAAHQARISGGGGDFEVTGEQFEAGPYGIGVPKEPEEQQLLREALRAALAIVIGRGEYDALLQKWSVVRGSLKTVTTNGGR